MRWLLLSSLAWLLPLPVAAQEPVVIEATLRKNVAAHKSIRLTGGFSPRRIIVRQGQTVTLQLKSLEGLHSLDLPGYALSSAEVNTGQTTTLTFVAERPGEFEFFCNSRCGGCTNG